MSRRLSSHQLGTLESADAEDGWVLMAHCTRIARNLAELGLLAEDDSGQQGPNHFKITEAGRVQLLIERTKIENAS